MFSFSRKHKHDPVEMNAKLRKAQIDSLQRYNPVIRATNDDQSNWQMGLRVSTTGQLLMVTIQLPADFPTSSPPIISIHPPSRHSLLNESSYVQTNDLMYWTDSSDMGPIVKRIIDSFSIQTPVPISASTLAVVAPVASAHYHHHSATTATTTTTTASHPAVHNPIHNRSTHSTDPNNTSIAPPLYASLGGSQQHQYVSKPDPVSRSAIPPIPNSFPELHTMSLERLKLLDSDSSTLKDYVSEMKVVVGFESMRNELMKANYELAISTKANDEMITYKLLDISNAATELSAKKEELMELVHRQQAVLKKYSREALLGKVKSHARKLDDESEDIGMDFSDGKISVKEFESSFIEKRKDYHIIDSMNSLFEILPAGAVSSAVSHPSMHHK